MMSLLIVVYELMHFSLNGITIYKRQIQVRVAPNFTLIAERGKQKTKIK
jgi:hypothetical protein